MAYTALVYSYRASFHDECRSLCHTHCRYRPQLPYKSRRTYLTNHVESISRHIMLLVINSLGGGHTHTHAHKHTCIHLRIESNSKKPGTRRLAAGAPGLKIRDRLRLSEIHCQHSLLGYPLSYPVLAYPVGWLVLKSCLLVTLST